MDRPEIIKAYRADGAELGYIGFIDKRLDKPFYVLDGDPAWLIRQRDHTPISIDVPERGLTNLTLGSLRSDMEHGIVCLFYIQYASHTDFSRAGVRPFETQRPQNQ